MGWLFYVVLALLTGAAVAIQGPTNQAVRVQLGFSGMVLVSMTIAFSGALVIAFAFGDGVRPLGKLNTVAPVLFLGGVYGFAIVCCAPIVVRELGVTTALTVMVLGQLIVALILDHFGAFGLERRPISWLKIVGIASVVIGIVLVRWQDSGSG